jgi:hypothetical protein
MSQSDGCRPGARLAIRQEFSDGTWITIEPTKPLTADTVSEVIEYLQFYQRLLAKRAKVETASVPVPDE